MRALLLPLGVVATVALGGGSLEARRGEAADASSRRATREFLAALRPESRERATFAFEDAARLDWHFVPRARPGLPLAAMDDGERRAAHALLRAVLTPIGYARATGVLELEAVLREIERNPGRDPGRFCFSVFGDPATEEPWSLRFEGHHLSLNVTGLAEAGIASTPWFLGANPAEVRHGAKAGFKLLAPHEEAARRLVRALPPAQRQRAVIATSAPADVLFGPGREPEARANEGIALAELSSESSGLARELLAQVLADFAAIEPDLDRELAGGRFVWAGGLDPGDGHYWRVSAPAGILEYDNTQDGANHVHFLWRDPANDFAAEWLARHHALEHPPASK